MCSLKSPEIHCYFPGHPDVSEEKVDPTNTNDLPGDRKFIVFEFQLMMLFKLCCALQDTHTPSVSHNNAFQITAGEGLTIEEYNCGQQQVTSWYMPYYWLRLPVEYMTIRTNTIDFK